MSTEPTAETWRPVVGDLGPYEVSDRGRIRSTRTDPPTIMRPFIDRNGYALHQLRNRGGRQQIRAHVLVAAAFIGPRPAGLILRHLDGNPSNNTPRNLAYGTFSENQYDRVRHGTHPNANKTHCINGHAYTPENTIRDDRGHRHCRTCSRIKSHRRTEERVR